MFNSQEMGACDMPASFSIDQALEKARASEKKMAQAYGGGVK
jgi:hypothetical protein